MPLSASDPLIVPEQKISRYRPKVVPGARLICMVPSSARSPLTLMRSEVMPARILVTDVEPRKTLPWMFIVPAVPDAKPRPSMTPSAFRSAVRLPHPARVLPLTRLTDSVVNEPASMRNVPPLDICVAPAEADVPVIFKVPCSMLVPPFQFPVPLNVHIPVPVLM